MIKIPICDICNRDVNETLEITLPKILKRRYRIHGIVKDLRHRSKGWLCFTCVRLRARSALDFDGIWHKIIFPQMHRTGSRGKLRSIL